MATQVEPGTPFSARPTGTVTFLFSDIEGSASRWDGDRAAMAMALARHDELMRTVVESAGGYVFKTMGDAFCIAFARPQEAIAAALNAQRSLNAEDFSAVNGLRVRMALHTGTADERDGDYFGPAVNRVARLLAIGHGGQVLLSAACAELVQGDMPPQSSLRDLGAHRLKDLARAEQVYQLIAPGMPESFPPLRSLDELPNNLPRQLTSFVGRENVVAEIAALIEKCPLVTLVGTGGAGKTRCAVQVGAEVLDGSGDGVWLAELAPITDPSLVATVIAKALNIQTQSERPVLETLLTYLRRKRLLLILDNCEHVIDEARSVVNTILRECPDVRVLATSREGLNIAGEHVSRMPSLDVPAANAAVTHEAAQQYGALTLFVDRATAADGRFAFTDEHAPHIAEICRRLDGIPLAIELAAARVKMLSPEQLAQKLDERFRLLTGGDRTALPRQQTMRALIDWSYDLLHDDERTLFRKLAIFAGGFTLELASAVCSDDTIDEIAVLDLLTSLVDKSLVHAELAGSTTRYRLLESTRQYAREKLIEQGEEEAVAHAHAAAFLELAEHLDKSHPQMTDRAWYAQTEPEMENWRAALTWTLADPSEILTGQRIAGALRTAFAIRAPIEGREWVRRALESVGPETPPAVIAKLVLADAELLARIGHLRAAVNKSRDARLRYEQLADVEGIMESKGAEGSYLVTSGELDEGEVILKDALQLARRSGNRRRTGVLLRHLAVARGIAGDITQSRSLFTEALATLKSVGSGMTVANIEMLLAEAEFAAGNAHLALQLANSSIAVNRALKSVADVMNNLLNSAAYLIALERWEEARARAREALGLARDAQIDLYFTIAVLHLAAGIGLHGNTPEDKVRAAHLIGFVDAHYTALDTVRERTEQQEYDKLLAALHDSLSADQLEKFISEGAAWTDDQAADAATAPS